MNKVLAIVAGLMLLVAGRAPAATVLLCPFDSLEGWSVRMAGAADAAIVKKTDKTRCVEITSRRGSAFLSRELPLEAMQGCRVTVSCLVKCEGVTVGPQLSSTAKVHLAVQTPRGVQHHNARFVGNADWHHEGFTADVPEDAQRVLLNIGLEACDGRAMFDRLIVRNDQRGVHHLDLSQVANAGHEQLGLTAFPQGMIEWEGVTFQLIDAAENDGADCFRLRGLGHQDWPGNTTVPIPVNSTASAIYILHAAIDGREMSETPCAMWSAEFVGGNSSGLSLFEGREIGPVGGTEDLDNWHVAWRQQDPSGKDVTFGVTKWSVYIDAPILWLSCRAYRGASPVVLAVTVVEEPPAPQPEPGEFDEMGEPFNVNE